MRKKRKYVKSGKYTKEALEAKKNGNWIEMGKLVITVYGRGYGVQKGSTKVSVRNI